MARKKQISREHLEELRLLIEELDLVPLSVYPPEVRPLVRQYLIDIQNEDVPFDNEIERVSVNVYLRNRKKKPRITEDDLLLIL